MTKYAAPLEDMRFALYDVLDAERALKALPRGEALNRELIDAVLDEAARFSEQVLAPLNQSGDAEGCHYDKASASVTTPAGFKDAN
ncbi:Acyl-CoA dehydrogenase, partial [mine drainage metagenome]